MPTAAPRTKPQPNRETASPRNTALPSAAAPDIRSPADIFKAARIAASQVYAHLLPFTDDENEALTLSGPDGHLSSFALELATEAIEWVSGVVLSLRELRDGRTGHEYDRGGEMDRAWDYLDRILTLGFMVQCTLEHITRTHDSEVGPLKDGQRYLADIAELVRHQLVGSECMPRD